jgi:GNAT superfamily N-acetyltransferase
LCALFLLGRPANISPSPAESETTIQPVICPYQSEDHASCRALWVELTQRHRDIYADPTIGGQDPGQWFDSYLSNPNRKATWVADVGGRVIGMTGLISTGEEAEVEPLIVTAGERRRGIGSLLVKHAVGQAKPLGVRFLSAKPVARNVDALTFFAKAGFDILGYVDLFQDLGPAAGREWKDGIRIHTQKLRY